MTAGDFMKLAPKPFKLTKLVFWVLVSGLIFLLLASLSVHKPTPRLLFQTFSAGVGLMIFFFLVLWGTSIFAIWVWSGLMWMRTYFTEVWLYLTRR
jgi:hypothetical protein